jgi:hypothetical protein
MPSDPSIPVPENAESDRATYQALAERVGVLAPGVSLSEELLAFANGVADMASKRAKAPVASLDARS